MDTLYLFRGISIFRLSNLRFVSKQAEGKWTGLFLLLNPDLCINSWSPGQGVPVWHAPKMFLLPQVANLSHNRVLYLSKLFPS